MNISKVIDTVVKNDLCIGCGFCVYKCPNNALQMKWNEYGFIVPELSGTCDLAGDCMEVCPFNPYPKEEVKTENELAEIFLKDSSNYHQKTGRYIGIYAGYANEFRLSSSSGGIATYIFTELLEKGIVNHIFSVKESSKPGIHYEYAVSSSKEELLKASKTKYYPVTLATVLPRLKELKGNVAIVGVACFIKAIRLAQHKEPELKVKIPFLVGIICGGVKSRFFTEYLAGKAGVAIENIKKPQFRIKDFNSTAGDYSFGCYDIKNKNEKTFKMRSVGDMWGTGLFKANACDFCDDVTTELADISLGDAWLSPYHQNGLGANIIITRSLLAQKIILKGIESSDLCIDKLLSEQIVESQQGSYNHRHYGLGYRIRKQSTPVPPKRFDLTKITLDFKLVQRLRQKARYQSLEFWRLTGQIELFDINMKNIYKQLWYATRIYHYRKAIWKRLKNHIN